jgi:glucose/arabinose dehydrogenase
MNKPILTIVAVLCLVAPQKGMCQKLALESYVTGFDYPIDVKNCSDNRLFVPCQDGRVWIINANGTLRPTPFLDISSKVLIGGEDGILGMAFSPNYKTNGKFYLYYIGTVDGQATTFIEQYTVSAADSNIADPSSALTLLTQTQPENTHAGGNIMFAKDGYLYIDIGDGVLEHDALHAGQDLTTLLGKILRIDVSNSSVSQPYAIPPTNPFYNNNTPGIKKEILAFGLRNPWRASVDRLNGDLWISDVGDAVYEEVNYHPMGQAIPATGINYGWSRVEGDSCYDPATGCNKSGITMPLYQYQHPTGKGGCVIGGYVYRSAQSRELFGTYIFADWSLKWIKGIKQTGGVVTGPVTDFLDNTQMPAAGPISFGEDWMGDQYIVAGATVYKISDTSSQRHPKAYYTATAGGGGADYLLQGLQGKNLTYQWLKNGAPILGAVLPNYTVTTQGNYQLVVTNALSLTDTSNIFPFEVLPIGLISFTAQKIASGQVALQWKTANESNVKGYTIQRKKNNETDFSNIGFVAAKSLNGYSNSENDYNVVDTSLFTQRKIFYRLQIEYADGSIGYSKIIYLTLDQAKNGFLMFPNPARDRVQIYLGEYNHPVVMSLYDYIGKKIKQQTITQQSATIDLPPSKGVYVIELRDEDGSNRVRKKIIVN